MKSKSILSAAILVVAVLLHPVGATPLGTPGTHGIEFDFTFTGVPALAQTAATEAGHRISNMLTVGSGIANQTITVDLTHSTLPMDVLGGASPQFGPGVPSVGFNSRMVPNEKAVTGTDANGAGADVVVEMSDGTNGIVWDYIDPIGGAEFDYQSTILHEVIHGMGFAEGIAENGGDAFGSTPGDPGVYSVWDEFVGDSTGTLIDGAFQIDVARWDTAVVGGTGAIPPNGNGLYFYGPQAVAANGGNPVPLYSPSTGYESGSSGGGHLDTLFYGDSNRLMNHASPAGPDQRVLSPEELGMMFDIGYRAVVPEPSSILLLVMSFVGIAAGIRRQR